jgi:hypothetical protein
MDKIKDLFDDVISGVFVTAIVAMSTFLYNYIVKKSNSFINYYIK